MLQLIPKAVRFKPRATPFLTSREDPDVSCERAVFHSTISGDIFVFDLLRDGRMLRRMFFSGNKSIIQSETPLVHLKPDQTVNKGGTSLIPPHCYHNSVFLQGALPDASLLKPDYNTLSAAYHQAFITGLLAIPSKDDGSIGQTLLIGLGGGALPMFLVAHFDLDLCVVELDPVVVQVAKDWFNMDASILVRIQDGVQYVMDQAQQVIPLQIKRFYDCGERVPLLMF